MQIKDEIERFLRAKSTSNLAADLADYPNIRVIFMKFNCIRSSEAICERLFSFAGGFFSDYYLFSIFVVVICRNSIKINSLFTGMILTKQRNRLSPEFFEQLLLLHMNDDW